MPIIRTGGNPLDDSRLTSSLSDSGSRTAAPSRDGVSISDILNALKRHALLVAAVTCVVGALASASVFLEAPTYRATAVIRLTDGRRAMTRGLDEAPPAEQGQRTNPLRSRAQLLTSRAALATVVDSQGLRLRPTSHKFSAALLTGIRVDSAVVADSFFLSFSNDSVAVRTGDRETRVAYGSPYTAPGISFTVASKPTVDKAILALAPRERTIDELRAQIKVTPRDETDVADIAYDDEVPEIAQRVVNVLVTTFQNMDVEQAQAESRRRRIFLTEQLREIDTQLARSEQALTSFRSRQQSFSSRDKMQAQQSALMALDIRQGELSADRRTYSTLLQRLQDSLAGSKHDALRSLIAAPEISSNAVITQLYQQLAQYQNAHDSLTTGPWRSAAGNPDVTRLEQLISGSEQRLVSAVRGQIGTIDARLEALGALRSRNATEIGALPRTESDEERLARQVESNRALADRLRDEYEKARMAEAVEAGQVAIVDLAALPYRAVPKLRTLRLLLGVFLGLAIGGVLALLRDSTNSRVRRRLDLEQEMRIPVLSVIPRITVGADDHTSWRRISSRLMPRNMSLIRHGTDGSAQGSRPQTAAAFMSPAGNEAFRLLRSSLKWTQRDAEAKTLAISSAMAEEGKTTTAANLAVVCALEGKRVLLIDCDMRRPRLHEVFRVPQSPGLAQVLRAGLDPATAVRDTSFHGLSFLPAGRDTDTIADYLGSDRMRALLLTLSEHFDVIIIDTPPVLGVADAVALAPLVDGVVMVVGAGKTDRQAVEQALGQLTSAGARVLGAVLNDSRGEVERYGNNEYYQYSGNYSQSKSTA